MSQVSEGMPLVPRICEDSTTVAMGSLFKVMSDLGATLSDPLPAALPETIGESLPGRDIGSASVVGFDSRTTLRIPALLQGVDAPAAPRITELEAAAETERPAVEAPLKGGGGTGRGRVMDVHASYPVPGVLERLRLLAASGIPHDDPQIAQVLPLPQLLGFIRETGVVREDALNLLVGDETYVAAIRRGFIDTLLLRLAMFRKRTAVDSEMWIPVAEIHCPEVAGCEAAYQWISERKANAQLRVTLLGSGGGAGSSSELKFKREIKAKAGCRRILVRAKVILEEWRADPGGEVLKVINVREITSGVREVGFDRNEVHRCSDDLDQAQRWITETEAKGYKLCDAPYDLTWRGTGTAEVTQDLEVRKGMMLETTVSTVVHGVGIALELKSEVIRTFGYSYKLTEPCYYLGFYGGPGSSSYNWAWRPA